MAGGAYMGRQVVRRLGSEGGLERWVCGSLGGRGAVCRGLCAGEGRPGHGGMAVCAPAARRTRLWGQVPARMPFLLLSATPRRSTPPCAPWGACAGLPPPSSHAAALPHCAASFCAHAARSFIRRCALRTRAAAVTTGQDVQGVPHSPKPISRSSVSCGRSYGAKRLRSEARAQRPMHALQRPRGGCRGRRRQARQAAGTPASAGAGRRLPL